MIRKVLILLILVSYVVSDSCVRYTFEEDFDEWLTNEWGGACLHMHNWIVGKYSTSDLTSPNKLSTSFIEPFSTLSCVSSFIFTMNLGGTIEVNIYMDGSSNQDQIIVLAYEKDINGDGWFDRSTGIIANSAGDPSSFVRGWHTLKITLTGSSMAYGGYISIMGMASPNSVVLIDSFRYIPPGMDESECRLYEDHA